MYLGRLVAQVGAKDVTSNQVVELITTSRSGSIGMPADSAADTNGTAPAVADSHAAAPTSSFTSSREDTP